MKSLTPGRKTGGKVKYRSIGGKVGGNDIIKMIYDWWLAEQA